MSLQVLRMARLDRVPGAKYSAEMRPRKTNLSPEPEKEREPWFNFTEVVFKIIILLTSNKNKINISVKSANQLRKYICQGSNRTAGIQ